MEENNTSTKTTAQFRYSILALIVVQAGKLIYSLADAIPLLSDSGKLLKTISENAPGDIDMSQIPPEFFKTTFLITFSLTILTSLLILFFLARKLPMESSGKYITRGVMIVILVLSLISLRQFMSPLLQIVDKVLILVNLFLSAVAIYTASILNRTRQKKTRKIDVNDPNVIDPQNYKH